jgi:DNA-binding GntR family transcriptional regulator
VALAYKPHAFSDDSDDADSAAAPPVSSLARPGRPTEAERVYWALKRAILAGELPPGVPLQEARLTAELGTSRTPIREAFRRLEGDGLLTVSLRRGAFVQ